MDSYIIIICASFIEAPPHMYAKFSHYTSLVEGDNITLTINVTTDLLTLFNGSVTWKVFNGTEHELPPTSKVINYISDGVFHSNLSLYDLSYYNDIGNYTCTVSNDCGTSSVFVYIDISRGMSLLFAVIHCYNCCFLSKLVSSKHFHFTCCRSLLHNYPRIY